MSSQQRDTEASVFLRFHVGQSKSESFMNMFEKITGLKPMEQIIGLNRDAGEMQMVFQIPINEKENLRSGVKLLQAVFMRLYDFYPALSEKPSEAHFKNAMSFIRDTKSSTASLHRTEKTKEEAGLVCQPV